MLMIQIVVCQILQVISAYTTITAECCSIVFMIVLSIEQPPQMSIIQEDLRESSVVCNYHKHRMDQHCTFNRGWGHLMWYNQRISR